MNSTAPTRFTSNLRSHGTAILMGCLLHSFALAQDGAIVPLNASQSAAVPERYPAGSIQSVERADRALRDAAQERKEIEARFAEDESACYPKFFTTACLLDAKEHRRKALARVREVEIEANTFKRRTRVEERDKQLAEKSARKATEADQRNKRQEKQESETVPQSNQSNQSNDNEQGMKSD